MLKHRGKNVVHVPISNTKILEISFRVRNFLSENIKVLINFVPLRKSIIHLESSDDSILW